jgi:hypothetical protein
MSERGTSTRKIARRLTSYAAHVLPHQRADWAKAMASELDHIRDDHSALRWAVGCLFASFIARAKFMVGKSISMRQAIAMLLLSVVGLLLAYGALVAAEAVSVTRLVLFLGNDVGIPGSLLRIAILSLTALPIAYFTGYGLRRWLPALSGRIILVVALLWVLFIGLLQVYVYAPAVLGASILKILFVVIPLVLAGYRNRPERVT